MTESPTRASGPRGRLAHQSPCDCSLAPSLRSWASEDDPPGRINVVSLHARSTEERRSTSRRRRLTTRALADFGGALTGNLSPFAYGSCVVSERSFARSTAPLRFAPNRLRLRFLARPLVRRVRYAALHCHARLTRRSFVRGRLDERRLARGSVALATLPNRLRSVGLDLRSIARLRRLRFANRSNLARPLTRRIRCASLHCHALSFARVRPRGAGEPVASLNARPDSFAAVRLTSASLRLVSRSLAR